MVSVKDLEVKLSNKFPLKNAAGEELPDVFVELLSPASKEFRAAQSVMLNSLFTVTAEGVKTVDKTADQKEADKLLVLNAATVAFHGLEMDSLEGKDLVRAIYDNPRLGFIHEQVDKLLGVWGNFTNEPNKN